LPVVALCFNIAHSFKRYDTVYKDRWVVHDTWSWDWQAEQEADEQDSTQDSATSTTEPNISKDEFMEHIQLLPIEAPPSSSNKRKAEDSVNIVTRSKQAKTWASPYPRLRDVKKATDEAIDAFFANPDHSSHHGGKGFYDTVFATPLKALLEYQWDYVKKHPLGISHREVGKNKLYDREKIGRLWWRLHSTPSTAQKFLDIEVNRFVLERVLPEFYKTLIKRVKERKSFCMGTSDA